MKDTRQHWPQMLNPTPPPSLKLLGKGEKGGWVRNLFCLLTPLFCLLLFDCKKQPTDPPPPNGGPDTTSHNFTWQIDTLGYSGVLYDVAIIDENNIWAVGEIFLRDSSTGQVDPTAYGFATWNGQQWSFRRLTAIGPTGIVSNLVPRGIFAFASNNIWFASGGVFHYNGSSVTPYWINPFPGNPSPILSEGQTAEKLWGTSSSNIYAVGRNGAIAHFNGSSWQKVESGTSVDLVDVWGSPDGSVVWACGYAVDYSESVILFSAGQQFRNLWQMSIGDSGQPYRGLIQSGWSIGNDSVAIVGGEGIYRHRLDGTGVGRREAYSLTAFPTRIRSSSRSTIIVSGYNGMVLHYNGSTWKEFGEFRHAAHHFFSAGIRQEMAVIVGGDYSQIERRALVLIGKRNN
jgi:hypothetical protein